MAETMKLAEVRELFPEQKSLSSFFHMVNRVLPDGQVVLSVPPEMPAREAITLMRERGFSQVPVVQGRTVLGVFSYRAFALEVASTSSKTDPAELPVEEFLEHERPCYARLTDEFTSLVEALDVHDSVVVSGPQDLLALLTPMDVLRYLYAVADAFVLIEEIELALRALIRSALSQPDAFGECVSNALTAKYKTAEDRPTRLEDMTFDDAIAMIRDGRNWAHFADAFGGTRERARARLEPIRDFRNCVFHFRRELSLTEHDQLASCRTWLLRRIQNQEAKAGGAR
jgi:predicted transcriptional regulator